MSKNVRSEIISVSRPNPVLPAQMNSAMKEITEQFVKLEGREPGPTDIRIYGHGSRVEFAFPHAIKE